MKRRENELHDIYEPREDSYLMLEAVKKHSKGYVLDMGTGGGILALEAAKTADRVVAVDRNPAAIDAMRKVIARQGTKNIRLVVSDLFCRVTGMFDTIFFNPPYLPSCKKYPDMALDGGARGNEIILRFLEQAGRHLKNDGKILLLFSSCSGRRTIEEAMKRNEYFYECISVLKLDWEWLYVYILEKRKLLSKGRRGIVYLQSNVSNDKLNKYDKGSDVIAVKVPNPASKALHRIEIEAKFLAILNKHSIGPKLLFFKDGELGMEYIEGERILDFARHAGKKKIRQVLFDVLEQCFIMDTLGINKSEMTNPYKHIIIRKSKLRQTRGSGQKRNCVVMIDFERCRFAEHVKNVAQFVEFIKRQRLLPLTAITDIAVRMYQANRDSFNALLQSMQPERFDQRCYLALLKVPKGKVTTYKEIAGALGTRAYRAVGTAMKNNPYAPIVPCHRVIRSNLTLGGFSRGNKRRLLEMEGVAVHGNRVRLSLLNICVCRVHLKNYKKSLRRTNPCLKAGV